MTRTQDQAETRAPPRFRGSAGGRGLHEFCTPGCGSRQPPVAV